MRKERLAPLFSLVPDGNYAATYLWLVEFETS